MIITRTTDKINIGTHGRFGVVPDAPEPLDDVTAEEFETEKLKDMVIAISFNAREIAEEISDTEWIQRSNESRYTKEQAKVTAYDNILKLIMGEEE